jgi:hypothetical protein
MRTTLHTPEKIKKDPKKTKLKTICQIKMQLYQIPQLEGRKEIAKVVMWCVKPRLYSVKPRNSKRQPLFPSLKKETSKGLEREEWRIKMKNRKISWPPFVIPCL